MIIAIDGRRLPAKARWPDASPRILACPHLDTGLFVSRDGAALLDQGAKLGRRRKWRSAPRVASPCSISKRNACAGAKWRGGFPSSRLCASARGLIDMQRAFAARAQGAVLDGRDIGTVIAPKAHVKIFVTASPEARGQRRALGIAWTRRKGRLRGRSRRLVKRDKRDSERADAPLKPAHDAHVLDTTDLECRSGFHGRAPNGRSGAPLISVAFFLVNARRIDRRPSSREGALRSGVKKLLLPAGPRRPARNGGGASQKRCAPAERSAR